MKTRIILLFFFCLCSSAMFAQDDAQTEMKSSINDLQKDVKSLRKADKAIVNKMNKTNNDLVKQVNAVNSSIMEKEKAIAANADSIKNISASMQKMQAETNSSISNLESKSQMNTIFAVILFVLLLASWIVIMWFHRKNLIMLRKNYDTRLKDIENNMNQEHKLINDRIDTGNNNLKEMIGNLREETDKKIQKMKV